MKNLLAAAALIAAVCASANAADNQSVIAFSRASAGKFFNELVEVKGINVGGRVTVEGIVDDTFFDSPFVEYDPAKGELVFNSQIASFNSMMIHESCKNTGSFVGQTVFGAKVVVQKKTCERFFVRHEDIMGIKVHRMRLKMSADQYRTLKRSGGKAEVDLLIGMPSVNIPVDFSDTTDDATQETPTQYRMRVWTIYGRYQAIRFQLPGTRDFIEGWNRE